MTGARRRAPESEGAAPSHPAPNHPLSELPDAVRRIVVGLAADALGGLAAEDVPPALRQVARFVPTRRARAGAAALARTLERDAGFREQVAEHARTVAPEPAAALAEGSSATADPAGVAAYAYLLRSDGWTDLVARAADLGGQQQHRRDSERAGQELEQLRGQLRELRERTEARASQQGAELAQLRSDAEQARRRGREQRSAVREAERRAERATTELTAARVASVAAAAEQQAELRRLHQRLSDAESAMEGARRAARAGRAVDEARLWLLLETVTGAAQGLRRELALRPTEARPADAVAGAVRADPVASPRGVDDAGRLDQLLGMPRAHLVIDGYNVTKTGYGDLPLESQRTRLVSRLGGLAAQTGAEVTVVFDGAERLPVAPAAPRGVRVLFSPPGEIADELIRRLVRGEPAGRVVVVVSSDGEVASGIRRSGAYSVPSAALLRRLDQG